MFAVQALNVSKKFRIYHDRTSGLKERTIFWNRNKTDDFWALQDINLNIAKGTTVGLLGRNGSGKSTLLKILSRILYPTCGSVNVSGRVSTLLELGAGFHVDFTGRENIYLNASTLGLNRREIKEQLNDIIAFSELEGFIDNPVRNYSSGMYMRLGLAVAVHVEPEILLVDEVLAVGDLAFQDKCLAKIKELQDKGTTVIFVTHAPKQIKDLCDVGVWLDQGRIQMQGPAIDVADAYVKFMRPES